MKDSVLGIFGHHEVRVLDAGVAGVDVQVLQDANSQEQDWSLGAWELVPCQNLIQGNV
jgi:hypothetical protein